MIQEAGMRWFAFIACFFLLLGTAMADTFDALHEARKGNYQKAIEHWTAYIS